MYERNVEETCSTLGGELKKWRGIGSLFSKRYAEIQLCAPRISGRRLTMGISKDMDKAVDRDRFDKRYILRCTGNHNELT